jgi:hypothetical protein
VSEVQQLCADGKCNANEVDPEFGTTPLHWARLHGKCITQYMLLKLMKLFQKCKVINDLRH